MVRMYSGPLAPNDTLRLADRIVVERSNQDNHNAYYSWLSLHGLSVSYPDADVVKVHQVSTGIELVVPIGDEHEDNAALDRARALVLAEVIVDYVVFADPELLMWLMREVR